VPHARTIGKLHDKGVSAIHEACRASSSTGQGWEDANSGKKESAELHHFDECLEGLRRVREMQLRVMVVFEGPGCLMA
jgi:hypothetical protein